MQSAIFPGVFLPQRKNLSKYIFCFFTERTFQTNKEKVRINDFFPHFRNISSILTALNGCSSRSPYQYVSLFINHALISTKLHS